MISEKAVANRRIEHSMPCTLPVKKYIEKWAPGPYFAVKDDFLGMMLINSLTRKTKQVQAYTGMDCGKRKFDQLWKFTVPVRYQDNVVLPARRVIEFNNFIEKVMKIELITNMEQLRTEKNVFNIHQAINEFREKYGLYDKDLSDEGLRKMYFRFRKGTGTINSEFSTFSPGMLLKGL